MEPTVLICTCGQRIDKPDPEQEGICPNCGSIMRPMPKPEPIEKTPPARR